MSQPLAIEYRPLLHLGESFIEVGPVADRHLADVDLGVAMLCAQEGLVARENAGIRWAVIIEGYEQPLWLRRPKGAGRPVLEEIPTRFSIEWSAGVPVGGAR
jgi:hypothetical protein